MFASRKAGEQFKIKGRASCKSYNIIYLIQCGGCGCHATDGPPKSGPPGPCTAATDGPPGPSMAPQTVPLGPSVVATDGPRGTVCGAMNGPGGQVTARTTYGVTWPPTLKGNGTAPTYSGHWTQL